ncbi:MAG: FAD-dependent oxidoreductase [Pseudomonadota bacterium]
MSSHEELTGEVTILGAGIVGVCCALSLQEKGYAVTLVDRQPPGEATSYGNAGVISPWSCIPQCMPGTLQQIPGWLLASDGPVSIRWRDLPTTLPWALKFLANTRLAKVEKISEAMSRLVHENVEVYRRFLKGTGHENLLRDSWYVNVFRGTASPALSDLAWRLRIDKGAPVEIVEGGEVRDIEPAISEDYHTAVIIKDQARAMAPGRLCKVLADKAKAQGARFVRAEVRGIERAPTAGYVLVTSEANIPVKRLVLAAGVWSADLLKPFGIKLPLISERGYHLEFSDPGVSLNHSVADVQGKFVVSSMDGGLRSAGTAEFAHHSAPPRYSRADMLGPQTKKLLPALNIEPNERWMGVRPSFPDNLPAIGELPGHAGLFAAFGHSHYGLGMAPATGRLIAGMVDGSLSNAETSDCAPDRFD